MHMLSEQYIHFRRWRNLELGALLRLNELFDQHRTIMLAVKNKEKEEVRKILHKHIDTIELYGSILKNTKNEFFYKK